VSALDAESVAIAKALRSERLLNARRTHLVRLVGISFFAGLFVLLGVVLGDREWTTDLRALFAYVLFAAVCVAAARSSEKLAGFLALAPAFLDMPFVYLVQRGQYETTPSPAAVAGFSMGIFALLLAIASLSASRAQIYLAALSAAVWEVLLQLEAGVSVGGEVSAVALLGLTAFILGYASDRRERLLVSTSRAEKLAALGQLSAAVGHDLRQPLAAIGNSIFVLRRRLQKAEALTEKVEEPLKLAEREVGAAERIVTELLDYARERKLELLPVPMRVLLEECAELVRTPAQVSVKVEVPEGLPDALGERDRLRQIFVNLVQNGVEAIPEGRAGAVVVHATADEREVKVFVRDDGAGMSAETKARVLEPLFTTKKDGTGLGLAIVDSLVRQHGGTLQLESQPGQGTTITVRLPRA
jgi:signal transduction histidine kinase